MSPTIKHRRALRAFSLAEILIVIGIIGILIALLIPTVTKIRAQARTTQCASNLSQIYKAQLLWNANNTRDVNSSSYSAQGWMAFLKEYCASSDYASGQTLPQIYFCPEDARSISNAGTPATGGTGGTSGTGGTAGGTGGTGTGNGGGNLSNILPQNLAVRWYTTAYGDYTVPLAAGPRVHATVMSTNPNSYLLAMEQEPASVNENLDFNDAVFLLKDNGDGTTTVTLQSGDGSAHALYGDLIDASTNTIIWSHLYRGGGTTTGTTFKLAGSLPTLDSLGTTDPTGSGGTTGNAVSKTVAHYGLNYAINDVMGHGDKVVGMDYLVDLITVNGTQIDDWYQSTWVDDSHNLRFARHNKQVNVLFGDGSVKLTQMIPDDPKWSPIKVYQAAQTSHAAGPYLMSANWVNP